MLKSKNCVSISNRAGAALFKASIICLVCTVLAHFSSYNNTQQLRISSPPLGEGGISHMVGKSAKVHCNGAANIKNFKK